MAHGVPVIATQAAAEGSHIRHGENGLIARDANEFAGRVAELWQDRTLCQRLGETARETIAAEFSDKQLQTGIAQVLAE
jgi:glycosyltransferase involved in cell wall biosynthesis